MEPIPWSDRKRRLALSALVPSVSPVGLFAARIETVGSELLLEHRLGLQPAALPGTGRLSVPRGLAGRPGRPTLHPQRRLQELPSLSPLPVRSLGNSCHHQSLLPSSSYHH